MNLLGRTDGTLTALPDQREMFSLQYHHSNAAEYVNYVGIYGKEIS